MTGEHATDTEKTEVEIEELVHKPLGSGAKVEINLRHTNDDSERIQVIKKKSHVKARYSYYQSDEFMPKETCSTEFNQSLSSVFNTIERALTSVDLDDSVERTLNRLLTLGEWMKEQGRLAADEARIDVHHGASFDPFDRNAQLVLVTDTSWSRSEITPLVVHFGSDRSDTEIQHRLDNTVNRLERREIHNQLLAQKDPEVTATEWQRVNSLSEADSIAYGDAEC